MSTVIIKESKKEQEVFRRRIRVIELKFIHGYRQSKISSLLGVHKSTITRDVIYLHTISIREILIQLEEYVKDLHEYMRKDDFRKQTVYDDQKALEQWLSAARLVLECYKDESLFFDSVA